VNEPLGDPLVAEEPAPIVRRALAYAADLATVGTWLWALSISHIAFWLQWSDERAYGPWGEYFLLTITFVPLFIAYQAIFTAKSGATPGQDLLRLQVVDARSGARLPLGTAVGRSCFVGLIWLFPWVWPALVLAAVFALSGARDPHVRMLHDHLCRTSVVLRLVPQLEPGQTVEEAEAKRKSQFMPRMANPIQITPMQQFRHPHLRPGDPDEDEA